jgi:hypothetical protein
MPPRMSERTETSERVFCERVWKLTLHLGRPCPLECSECPPRPCRSARNLDDARQTFASSHGDGERQLEPVRAAARLTLFVLLKYYYRFLIF